MSALAALLVRIATRIMPSRLRHWGEAMECEVRQIEDDGEALHFALGCLGGAIRARLEDGNGVEAMNDLQWKRDRLVAACAIAATACGLAYMSMAGAPARYLAVNGGALLLGFLAVAAIAGTARLARLPAGAVHAALGAALLGASLFGTSVEGATRWVAAGGLFIQPSLILLPVLAIGFGRERDPVSLIGVLLAASALALQPDRAMAGALAAAMLALALLRREWVVFAALAASVAGFAVTILRPDLQLAVPFVDRILFTAFDVHPLAGLAVVGGAALLLLPALAGIASGPARREGHAVFGALWLAIVAAAALGNYPTPLVGYSGSAVLGYVLCLLVLPGRAHAEANASREAPEAKKGARGSVSRVLSSLESDVRPFL